MSHIFRRCTLAHVCPADSDQPAYLCNLIRLFCVLVCVEVLWPSQPNGVMSSVVSLPNHTFTGQA